MPGCLTVTAIDVTGDEVEQLDAFAERIVGEIAQQPGYLGTLFATTSDGRFFTIAAWSSVEAVDALRQTSHSDAMRAFFKGELGTRVVTSIWTPHQLNNVWVKPEGRARPERADPSLSAWL
jgi:quinol monooxygenase YgiN